MFIASVAFIAGLYIKVILLIFPRLTLRDFGLFLLAGLVHLVAFVRFFTDGTSFTASLLISSFFFIAMTSFFFMDKILPKITEGTLLLYGLIALWICLEASIWNTQTGLILTILVAIYSIVLLILCTTHVRIIDSIQVMFVFIFLLFNIFITLFFLNISNSLEYFKIGYEFNYNTVFSVMMLGFMLFQVVSNIFYVLAVLPIPSRGQTLKQRALKVKTHIEKLRASYVDTDLAMVRTVVICGLFLLLCLNTFLLAGFDSFMLLVFTLFFGTWVADDYSKTQEVHKTVDEYDVPISRLRKIILTVILVGLFILPFVTYRLTRNIDLSILDKSLLYNSTLVSSPSPSPSFELSEADVLVEKGLAAFNAQDYLGAESYLLHALRLDSQNKYAHNNLGLAYLFQERYQESEEEFLKALAIDTNYANAHNNIGRLYYARNQYANALFHLNRASELNPRSQTYISLGDVYAITSNDIEALEHYKKAKELDPSNMQIDEAIRVTEFRLRNR